MKLLTRSWGIAKNRQLARILQVDKIYLSRLPRPKVNTQSVLVGWGYKKNTLAFRQLAQQQNIPFWSLEDGFIACADHPSQESQRLSLIKDDLGIYYNSRAPSGLDKIIKNRAHWYDPKMEARAQRVMEQCVKLGVSKYNQARSKYPCWLQQAVDSKRNIILLVDQTFGDCSIVGAQADERDFQRMLQWAELESGLEDPLIVIKTHPDVLLGKKKGHFSSNDLPSNAQLLADDVSPKALIAAASKVATVCSQLGFEALWQHKEVHCFGVPFYAQRGLTIDHSKVLNNSLDQNKTQLKSVKQVEKLNNSTRESVTLNQLFAAAMIQYPIYFHPSSQTRCQIEDILNYLQASFQNRAHVVDQLNIVDVSLWKRSFLPCFIDSSAKRLRYVKSPEKLTACHPSITDQSKQSQKNLIWGMKDEGQQPSANTWRVEDGFIRSVGLGADLRRPSSLVIDDLGIYYNGHESSRLEQILNNTHLNDYEVERAKQLLALIQHTNITKYNVDHSLGRWQEEILSVASGKEIILVVGQFQDDLSIRYGTNAIKTNMALIEATREQFPDAFLIFKEHPDVFSGVRPGKLNCNEVEQIADRYVSDTPITELYNFVSRVSTMCSLSGFEALIRGLPVTVFGLPFYAGWGLSHDAETFSRRHKKLNLLELLYGSLVLYPRYIDWNRRSITNVEQIVEQLSSNRQNKIPLKSTWFARQIRKLRYLIESFFA